MNVLKVLICVSVLALMGALPSVAETVDSASDIQATKSIAFVNINTASVERLAEVLKGVGVKRAQAIVDYREENGPFTDISQLIEIKGVSTLTVEKNIDKIKL